MKSQTTTKLGERKITEYCCEVDGCDFTTTSKKQAGIHQSESTFDVCEEGEGWTWYLRKCGQIIAQPNLHWSTEAEVWKAMRSVGDAFYSGNKVISKRWGFCWDEDGTLGWEHCSIGGDPVLFRVQARGPWTPPCTAKGGTSDEFLFGKKD